MATYSLEDEARKFVLQRVLYQQNVLSYMDTLVKRAIKDILDISRRYRIPPSRFSFSADRNLKKEVDAVIDKLLDDILGEIKYMVTKDEEDDDRRTILLWLLAAFKGKTISQRLAEYLKDLLDDILPQVAASMAGNKSSAIDSVVIFNSLTNPESSRLYQQAVKNGYPGTKRKRSPVGVYIYAFNNLKRAVSDQVARTMQQTYYDIKYKETTHWLVMRGSRYPCSLCDSMCGITTKHENLPPFHPNCCCYAVPLDGIPD